MLQKIESYMRESHMIEKGGHVVAGVSGGADSVCLFRVLYALREVMGYTMSVVHVEHGIRGAESLEDALFVERLCEEYGVGCRTVHYRVPEFAKEQGLGEEEAGRQLRYQAFEEECLVWEKKMPGRKVWAAVAHNRNDNAETMLFHLARGTGIRGLAGIPPARGRIIRPLLRTDREEIEKYLQQLGQAYRTDSTNQEEIYSRNRIRHRILPELQRLNEKAAAHMEQTALELQEIEKYLEKQTEAAARRCVCWEGSGEVKQQATILWESYRREARAIQSRLIYLVLEGLAKGRKDLTRDWVLLVGQLFKRQTGRRIRLGQGLAAWRVYEGVRISRTDFVEKMQEKKEEYGELPLEITVPEGFGKWAQGPFEFELADAGDVNVKEFFKKKYTKCFDYDKIKNSVCIRNRLPGDYLAVDDDGRTQKLKKYLVNEKIPSTERGNLCLLADGSHILWVVGHRISSYYKVGRETRRILKVTFYGGRENG